MSEVDVQAVLKTVLCSYPNCPDDAAKGESTCARHRATAAPPSWESTEQLLAKGYDPINGCKIRGCMGTPANTRGIYAFLCPEHVAEKRETAGRRQAWADAHQPNVDGQRERLGHGSGPLGAGQRVADLAASPRQVAARIRDAALVLERAQLKVDRAKAELSTAKRAWRAVLDEAAR